MRDVTELRRPGRPRKYDADTVAVSCRLTAEQVSFLDGITGKSRSEALALVAGAGIKLAQGMKDSQQK